MGELIDRTAARVASACLLAAVCSCSSHAGQTVGEADAGSRAQATATAGKTASAPADGLGFELVNFTGSTLRAVYISPSDSKGWEENVLGGDEFDDGKSLDINFSREERAALWDIRVEGTDGHYAEWKGLDLRGASRVTLLIGLDGQRVVAAEVE